MKSITDRIERYRLRRGDSRAAALYARVLTYLIRTGQSELAVEWFVQHPAGGFAEAFIAAAGGVDGAGIDRVYAGTKRTLGQMVRDGDLRDPDRLRQVGVAVLRTYCRHHACLAYHRDRPLLPPDGGPVRRSLFAPGADVARLGDPAPGPAVRAGYPEALARVLREAKSVGQPFVRVLQIVRRYEHAHGTSHGAVARLARMAVVDKSGRVAGFRPWRAAPAPVPPPRTVYRRVRAVYLEAVERLRTAGRRLDLPLPPAGG